MVAWLVDPQTNADWAYKISKSGTDWADWATYGNGAYKQYLVQATAAFQQISAMSTSDLNALLATGSAKGSGLNTNSTTGDTEGQGQTATNPLDWLSNVGSFFTRLSDANTWLRIGEFILGGGLVLVALAHLMGDTSIGKAAKSVATKAALL